MRFIDMFVTAVCVLFLIKNHLFIYTRLFENFKGRILKKIITRSEMGQQTAQSKKVYFRNVLLGET